MHKLGRQGAAVGGLHGIKQLQQRPGRLPARGPCRQALQLELPTHPNHIRVHVYINHFMIMFFWESIRLITSFSLLLNTPLPRASGHRSGMTQIFIDMEI